MRRFAGLIRVAAGLLLAGGCAGREPSRGEPRVAEIGEDIEEVDEEAREELREAGDEASEGLGKARRKIDEWLGR